MTLEDEAKEVRSQIALLRRSITSVEEDLATLLLQKESLLAALAGKYNELAEVHRLKISYIVQLPRVVDD